jgi:hypothetical protein
MLLFLLPVNYICVFNEKERIYQRRNNNIEVSQVHILRVSELRNEHVH